MARRTLENCSLIQKCVKAGIGSPEQKQGKCEGYQRSYNDDEPCVMCGGCPLNAYYYEYNEDFNRNYEY